MDSPVRSHGIATPSNLDHHPYTRQQPALVNPTTPLAFLPPDVAFHVTIAIYILVLTCAVFIWDILSNLRTEYERIRDRGWKSLALIVYMVSRLASLGFILAATIYATAPAGDCATFDKVVDWFYPVAVSSTAFYFFLRLRAVYLQRRRVVLIFGFLWLAVVGSCLTATQGGDGTNIGSTSMVSGEGMGHVHRTLLKEGQWYIIRHASASQELYAAYAMIPITLPLLPYTITKNSVPVLGSGQNRAVEATSEVKGLSVMPSAFKPLPQFGLLQNNAAISLPIIISS
ncbi:hypothetical protein CPC08DRAFT_722232 [Agrocybe pediades]|nr:hypothetical protein CPC08DRAFT_722232 [Agrocybe pediades]